MVNGLSGQRMLIALAIGIILLIIMVLKTKIQAFLALITATVLVGVIGGMPLLNVTLEDGKTFGIINSITSGFGGTLGSIGIIIGFGVMMGQIFEVTGAAKRMAHTFLKLFGKGREEEALAFTGFLVSIPIFCDSGFVILNPIRKALVQRTGASSVAMSIGLGSGLYIAHVFIPPTPGPIAAANTLGIGDNLLLVMGLGVVCSIFPLAAGYFYSNFIGKKVKAADEADRAEVTKTYEELVAEYGKLPSGISALAPIIVPIILMGISSAVSMAGGKGLP